MDAVLGRRRCPPIFISLVCVKFVQCAHTTKNLSIVLLACPRISAACVRFYPLHRIPPFFFSI